MLCFLYKQIKLILWFLCKQIICKQEILKSAIKIPSFTYFDITAPTRAANLWVTYEYFTRLL